MHLYTVMEDEKSALKLHKKFKLSMNTQLGKFELGDFGYRPFTIDEFIITFMGNLYLYDGLMDYFIWGYDILKKKK